MKRVLTGCVAGLIAMAALWPASLPAKDAKIVLLAGDKSHQPGEH